MTKDHCPLGDDCDLLIAYKHGLSSAKDIIIQNGKLEAERDEARMKSLADLGQAQDAYEAQKKAEAERDEALNQLSSMTHAVQMLERQGARSQRVENERDKLIENLAVERDKLKEALEELADLMDAVVSKDYTPDSFTTQPARAALGETKKPKLPRDFLEAK